MRARVRIAVAAILRGRVVAVLGIRNRGYLGVGVLMVVRAGVVGCRGVDLYHVVWVVVLLI